LATGSSDRTWRAQAPHALGYDGDCAMTEHDCLVLEIAEWIKRNGYVLEMEVALKILNRKSDGYIGIVNQGAQYRDINTMKYREIDVDWRLFNSVKTDGHYHVFTQAVIIECKGTQAPWIIFRDMDSRTAAYSLPAPRSDDLPTCSSCRTNVTAFTNTQSGGSRAGYAIVEKKTKGDRDHAREALLGVVSASIAASDEIGKDGSHYTGDVKAVVVTTSPLFVAELSPNGDVCVSQVDNHPVAARHEADGYPIQVDVMTPSALERYIDATLAQFWEFGKQVMNSTETRQHGQESGHDHV
jgi:hypothetical protein